MAMRADEIEKLILEALPGSEVKIEDLAGDGDHYSCHIKSKAFAGKSRVQQHKIVYDALGGRMGNELHALAIQTTPIEE
ncbi:MAG: BolA/IbaG family iron-sulfur metabolism protein [Candidatus Puniceispirillales bacterium]|nr:BolA family transcriptional regulator [Pseudomonadota bacterium]